MSNPRHLSQATLPSLENELGYAAITNLNNEQELFCWEYVLSGANAKLAYSIAYPKSKDTSSVSHASRLLKTDRVQKRIAEIREELQRRYRLDAQSVIGLLSMTMQADRRQFVDRDSGRPLDVHELPPEAAAITDIEIIIDRNGCKRAIPVVPKRISAADSIARILGINKDKVEFSGSVNVSVSDDIEQMDELRQRFRTIS
jgi:hypothetical protein